MLDLIIPYTVIVFMLYMILFYLFSSFSRLKYDIIQFLQYQKNIHLEIEINRTHNLIKQLTDDKFNYFQDYDFNLLLIDSCFYKAQQKRKEK